MSRRQLLNLTMAGVAALLVGAVLFAVTAGRDTSDEAHIALTIDQKELIQEIALEAARLATARDLATVTATRTELGLSIYRFDRNLAALLDGGTATDQAGRTVTLDVAVGEARQSLIAAADVWLRVGSPLSDLAVGTFSSFSAAGRAAVSGFEDDRVELTQHLDAAANAMGTTGERQVDARGWVAGIAAGLGILLVGIVALRRRPARTPREAAAVPTGHAPVAPHVMPIRMVATGPPGASPTPQPYTSPVDLESLSNSVDRLSVDMQTIGDSTDKMQLAIDSVGHALQGMLYSLKEMAQDTADGERVVKGANSAAGYTAEVAEALVESVREMSRVVGNVTELAHRTRQTSARLDTEAAHSDRTGRGFSLAVVSEARILAAKTSASTAAIEATVSEMLTRTREYEEAIGKIINHISAINRISQNLGNIMLNPPVPHMVPAPTRSVEPAGDPSTGAPESDAAPLATATSPDDFAAETAAAIEETIPVLDEAAFTPEATAEDNDEFAIGGTEDETVPVDTY